MPRICRGAPAGQVFHVLNRGNGRDRVFHDEDDFAAFVDLLQRAKERTGVRVYAYCLMPNHFHAIVEPKREGALSAFMQWWMTSHVRAYHSRYKSSGHVWQGRFKSFLVQTDEHFYTVVRYVLRNPVRAKLARRASAWRWSSVAMPDWLDTWPVAVPKGWKGLVEEPQSDGELAEVRQSLVRQAPFGIPRWRAAVAKRYGLGSTLRPRGRPRQNEK